MELGKHQKLNFALLFKIVFKLAINSFTSCRSVSLEKENTLMGQKGPNKKTSMTVSKNTSLHSSQARQMTGGERKKASTQVFLRGAKTQRQRIGRKPTIIKTRARPQEVKRAGARTVLPERVTTSEDAGA